MEFGSSSMGNSRAKKTGRTRRSWTQRDEEMLIVCLKDLVASEYKGENGFTVGYLNILEQNMAKHFPGRTGVGWLNNMVEYTDEQWDAIVKNDPYTKGMRYKAWPYLDDWKEIFGRDRATGEHAEDVMEAVNELLNSEWEERDRNDGQSNYYNINVDGFLGDNDTTSVCQTQKKEPPSRSAGKKRKSSGQNVDGLYELLGSLCRNTDDRLSDIAQRIGYEYNVASSRKQVYDMLGNIDGLTMDQKVDITMFLVKNVEYMEMFTGLPEDTRPAFVYHMLAKMQ